MSIGERLRERRERAALTQVQAAQALRIPRELISMWETGARTPGTRQLEEIGRLYGVSAGYLLGQEELTEKQERTVLYRGLVQDAKVRLELDRWVDFLDRWAEFLEDSEEELEGPGKPPRKLDEGQVITDGRRAPTLAANVREYYDLGASALPDLYAFLEDHGVLVYKASLGSIGQGLDGISGAFYNHPKLGFSILINADTSSGRQTFTLAHEYAHALFHYAERGLVSWIGSRDPKEVFANSFAGHFLVPGKELKEIARRNPTNIEVVSLASYFRVSYAMMLVRLLQEGLIDTETYEDYRQESPRQIAEWLGMDVCEFEVPAPKPLELERYPASVLDRVKQAIHEDELTPAQAAGLLEVDLVALQMELLSEPPEASRQEITEFEELELAL